MKKLIQISDNCYKPDIQKCINELLSKITKEIPRFAKAKIKIGDNEIRMIDALQSIQTYANHNYEPQYYIGPCGPIGIAPIDITMSVVETNPYDGLGPVGISGSSSNVLPPDELVIEYRCGLYAYNKVHYYFKLGED